MQGTLSNAITQGTKNYNAMAEREVNVQYSVSTLHGTLMKMNVQSLKVLLLKGAFQPLTTPLHITMKMRKVKLLECRLT